MVVAPCAVTVTVRVLEPMLRSRSAVSGVLVSSSPVMTTMAPLLFLVAVSLTASNRLRADAV